MNQKVAIVTGASRGIGAATAKKLAEEGYAVCVNFHTHKQAADKVVSDIMENGGRAIAVKADVAKENDIIALFRTVDRKLGNVTALVNNAAINSDKAALQDMSLEQLERMFATNVFGTFLCSKEALKRMKKGGGCIVNVSSQAAQFGGKEMTHYASSKAAINTFTIGFAREAAAYGIRVNAISPGVIDTDAHKGIDTERLAALKCSIPAGRLGAPREVANAICWLLSDNASYISGAIIPISGAR